MQPTAAVVACAGFWQAAVWRNSRAFAIGTDTGEETHDDFKPKYKQQPANDVEEQIKKDVSSNKVFIYMKVHTAMCACSGAVLLASLCCVWTSPLPCWHLLCWLLVDAITLCILSCKLGSSVAMKSLTMPLHANPCRGLLMPHSVDSATWPAGS